MEQKAFEQSISEHLQPSVIVLLFRLLSVMFLLDTAYSILVLGFFVLNDIHDWHNPYVLALWLAAVLKYIVLAYAVIQLFTQWAGRRYYIHGHHLIEKLGLINITETTHELSQVKSVIVSQTWLGRRFNYGTIKLTIAGGTPAEEVLLRDVTDPSRYKQYFDQHLQVQGWVR